MNKHLIFLLFIGVSFFSNAQIDKEFWFAPPEASEIHDDRPISLNLTCLDKPCQIEITQPANPNFKPYSISLGERSFERVDLTDQIDIIETKPGFTVLNSGLLITGDNYFSANYEIEGDNSDIFTLKGRRALGTEFIGQFQDRFATRKYFNNNGTTLLEAYHSLDVVAINPNTIVTIIPSVDLENHPKGIPFTVTLNRGQTYSVVNKKLTSIDRMNGTIIRSNKPISVSKKDDSVFKAINWDLIGDQLLPTSGFDTSYVAFSGFVNIVSNSNNNIVKAGDSTFTLQQYEYAFLPIKDTVVEIHANKPIGVMQFTEISNELAGAVVAPIRCTGSRDIAFQRSFDRVFNLFVVTKNTNSNFTLNGNPFTELKFQALNSEYHYAILEDDDFTIFNPEEFYTIESTADFQLSILFGSPVTGASYGFFSDFGFIELGDSLFACNNQNVLLDAGPSMDSYLWNTGSDSSTTFTTGEGEYTLKTTKDICTYNDTIFVDFVEGVSIQLVSDTFVCKGDSVLLDLPQKQNWTYAWSTSDSSNSIYVSLDGTYEVYVSDQYNCSDTTSSNVVLYKIPYLTLPNDTTICKNSNYILGEGQSPEFNYTWNTGDTTPSIPITEPNNYQVSASNECGIITDDVSIDFWDFDIPNIITPNQDNKNEFFVIQTQQNGVWEVEIYNRWGEKVFHSYDYKNTFNAEGLSNGVYYFSVKEKNATCTESAGWLMVTK